jgi:hypothetical protein
LPQSRTQLALLRHWVAVCASRTVSGQREFAEEDATSPAEISTVHD